MSFPVFSIAMLLTAAPIHVGDTPPVPAFLAAASVSDQQVPAAPTVGPASPPTAARAEPPAPPESAATTASPETEQSDIVVTARRHAAPGDPVEAINAKSFAATQAVDKAFVGPVALAYEHTVPSPIRSGLRNLLSNLHEPVVILNFLLQIKPGKAGETLGRFAINSTLGGAGLFDVAKRRPFNLPRRPNGFADTLGYYGVKPGPFLYLPLIGPTTLRDLMGGFLDRLVLPLSVGRPFNSLTFTVPIGVISTLDHRAEFDEQLHKLHDGAADPYVASREFYLRRRQAEIDQLHSRRGEASPTTPKTVSPSTGQVTPRRSSTTAAGTPSPMRGKKPAPDAPGSRSADSSIRFRQGLGILPDILPLAARSFS